MWLEDRDVICLPNQVMRTKAQRELKFKTWGGKRKGAGRKPAGQKANGPKHRARTAFRHRKPTHVTLRAIPGLPNFRERKNFVALKEMLRAGSERLGVRLVHFSVQKNHLHLIVEADDSRALSRGIKGLEVRLARCINELAGRTGRVFKHRYDVKILGTPNQVRLTLIYVLGNARKHAAQAGVVMPAFWIDPCSSGMWFDGWKETGPLTTEEWTGPATWLLRNGWQKHGRISVSAAPKM